MVRHAGLVLLLVFTQLVADGKIRLDHLITRAVPFHRTTQIYQMIERGDRLARRGLRLGQVRGRGEP